MVCHICPSKTHPFGAPLLLRKKKAGSLRLCMDYRVLNKVTMKNNYSIPLITDLFDRLGQSKHFTKVDLRKGYCQVLIAQGDTPKMAYVIRYGAFEDEAKWLLSQGRTIDQVAKEEKAMGLDKILSKGIRRA
ncbi:PREDICTED: uncharacterized protein LOC109224171 [Nicotiana attenuata]|uniref:uncharacterized protein LOC109224171 n=1 Tax=Nicotiana attenuata TaxID=49451 RepID=UPI0009056DBC|nr:PREDICTED: uncharacterized protein LOC109224171 [Nicotiana attenuata]